MKTPSLRLTLAGTLVFAALCARSRADQFTITTLAGSPPPAPPTSRDGTNSYARFLSPAGLAVDAATNIYVADGNAIRKIRPLGTNWVVATIAGLPELHAPPGADGTNSDARFNSPNGVALDSSGNLYVADTLNNTIRKVTPLGTNWVVTTLVGSNGVSGAADGTNKNATFDHPYALTVGQNGIIYVADTENQLIRKVTPIGTNWVVTTLAGLAQAPGSANGTNSTARFNSPAGIAVDGASNLYVADFGGQIIRKIVQIGTNGVVSTIAGLATVPGSADGTNTTARFNQPFGIAVDAATNLYVTDSSNNTLRKIQPLGTNWFTTTLAGFAPIPGSSDGIGPAARFNGTSAAAMSATGDLFISDTYNFTVRRGQIAIVLQVGVSSGQMTLSWPLAASGYVLQTSGTLSGPWPRLTNGISTSSLAFSFTTNVKSSSAFYRLQKP